MQYNSKTILALLATAYLPSAFGCLHFNATLHVGPNQATSAQGGVDIAKEKLSGQDVSTNDLRLDVYLWDDVNNDQIVEPLRDNFCSGVDLKPYADNTWTVPCTPVQKGVELDVYFNQDITEGGVLVDILKYNNPRAQSKAGHDKDKDLLYTFRATSKDGQGEFFETEFACGDCTTSDGVLVKCGNTKV
ncbi:Hypothetical predicted protein [Lecanosticta acicola]|uniref:Uncharacterized protein n=1 Tax=Lecanosticta acicola TaxID=111012 RepID=A0AAI9EEX1_9PEZI|nr:Hypothetical predicted protein [Lecanosticta acicola]